jgi:16S rRNA pseudouridine516 synthase
VAHKLHAAGRLDIDTTGLVLMTDDGQWSHRITSPRHHCEKTYLVTLESPLAEGPRSCLPKASSCITKKI